MGLMDSYVGLIVMEPATLPRSAALNRAWQVDTALLGNFIYDYYDICQ